MFINSANASSLAGGSGWRVASTVSNGIGVTVNGVKDVMVNGAKKTVTGVANVTPTASQVGKFMGKNLAGAAVIGAMDLLLDGVDYVLDPANNQIKYRPKGSNPVGYSWAYYSGGKWIFVGSVSSACQGAASTLSGYTYVSYTLSSDGKSASCALKKTSTGSTASAGVALQPDSTSTGSDQKTVPFVDLGSQVLDKAEEELRVGNPAIPIATPVTQAAAAAVVGEAATDETQARPITSELDKSVAIPTTETAVGEIAPPTTNPDTGEVKPGSISLDFPVFCSWAPSMCVLADKAQQAITDAREWVKESEATDTELDIPEQQQEETDTNINFNGSCPAKITLVNFNYHNNQQNWEVDFTEWCSAVTTYIRPIVISMGAFSALLIVSGVRINE